MRRAPGDVSLRRIHGDLRRQRIDLTVDGRGEAMAGDRGDL